MKENISEDGVFIDKKEESEASFWRLKKAFDKWRENRVNAILAQEGESVFGPWETPFCFGLHSFRRARDVEIVAGGQSCLGRITYFVSLYFVIGHRGGLSTRFFCRHQPVLI